MADAVASPRGAQGGPAQPIRTLLDFVAWAIGCDTPSSGAKQAPFLLDELPALGEASRRMQVLQPDLVTHLDRACHLRCVARAINAGYGRRTGHPL